MAKSTKTPNTDLMEAIAAGRASVRVPKYSVRKQLREATLAVGRKTAKRFDPALTNDATVQAMIARAKALWNRDMGPWAMDADGRPVLKGNGFTDVHSPAAVSFSRAGAIIRAIEEVWGRGKCTDSIFTVVSDLMPKVRG